MEIPVNPWDHILKECGECSDNLSKISCLSGWRDRCNNKIRALAIEYSALKRCYKTPRQIDHDEYSLDKKRIFYTTTKLDALIKQIDTYIDQLQNN